jgi:beta-phosphoglucomutase
VRGIIFDLDGVLADSMPAHYKAWEIAFKEVANMNVDERLIYLLEGMRGSELVKTIFEQKGFRNYSLVEKVNSRKNGIFKKPYPILSLTMRPRNSLLLWGVLKLLLVALQRKM